jgi:murein DD-endopeptidase MepM/ murein hydrolase activator NlpD
MKQGGENSMESQELLTRSNEKSRKRSTSFKGVAWSVTVAAVLGAAFIVYIVMAGGETAQPMEKPGPEAVKVRQAVEFRMQDLEHGWIRYEDGYSSTSDGGITWQSSDATVAASQPSLEEDSAWKLPVGEKAIGAISYQSKEYKPKQVQFATDRIGWALVSDTGELGGKLLATTDGGVTWHADAADTIKSAIQEEKQLVERRRLEAAFYASAEQAKLALQSDWLLLPDSVNQGDVVLVRSRESGTVDWQGKTYTLQPFGAGYFTYLPIGMSVKPGSYPIGSKQLKVTAKSFPTQHLTVTEQQNSMRQDTKRIEADQVKIDAARSKSLAQFAFKEPFVLPVEGRLTTPYGFTRYINGKLSGAHQALDLAAKEGTPIQAANDGVVALADTFYLTGHSIYIDHGMGLFSQYAHLSELKVKTGDQVKRGDIIGLVGSTGFSTGPHLHFTFWAHNVPVNPNLFMDTTPFRWTSKP